ncbi:hypothetical protein NDU88_000344 [Pleurodeles waltl]|uniref:Uncharacterized protein n=1 Tax=Pleurodeles waltl TaxID=8319 RepID=A0AAV7LUC8_PLEWA|nr:hypothetical protein NDU88_000344 [Pleurodeles waltl]
MCGPPTPKVRPWPLEVWVPGYEGTPLAPGGVGPRLRRCVSPASTRAPPSKASAFNQRIIQRGDSVRRRDSSAKPTCFWRRLEPGDEDHTGTKCGARPPPQPMHCCIATSFFIQLQGRGRDQGSISSTEPPDWVTPGSDVRRLGGDGVGGASVERMVVLGAVGVRGRL